MIFVRTLLVMMLRGRRLAVDLGKTSPEPKRLNLMDAGMITGNYRDICHNQ